jgi:hypothetical protein
MGTAAGRAGLAVAAACVLTGAVAGCDAGTGGGNAANPTPTRVVISASAFRITAGDSAPGQDKPTAAGRRNQQAADRQVTAALAGAGLTMTRLDVPESVSPCSVLLVGQTVLGTPTVEARLRAGLARLVSQGWQSTGGVDDVFFYAKGPWQLTASVGSLPGLDFVSASPAAPATMAAPATGTATGHLVNVTVQDLC